MKKVLVIGATGSLATVVIEELKKHGDVKLTLFARNINKLPSSNNITIIKGDALNYNDVKNAVSGHDIVYVNLAGQLEEMTTNIVKAMEDVGIKRIIAISSIGIYQTPIKPILKPYRALADIIENSALQYTILRPDWFTYETEIDYSLTKKGQPETGQPISRKSIAAFIATIINKPELYINENLGISKPS